MTNLEEKFTISRDFLLDHVYYKDGHLYWKKSYNSSIIIGSQLGSIHILKGEHRWRAKIMGRLYMVSRLIFLYHKGYLPETVDHIDRNPLNDRIENLREATRIENARNKSSKKNGSSQYLGVCFHIRIEKWRVVIRVNGKQMHIGYFDSETDAALAYNRFAVKYYKEFANLNIIKP